MGSTWGVALRRALEALGRRRRAMQSEGEESGFTLIELMVVLLIMGILMAIAIPTFLGVTSVANDRSTQSNLTNVLTSAKSIYSQADGFTASATVAAELHKQEPAFKYTTGASTKQGTISVYANGATGTPKGTTLVAAAYMTKTKVCWFIVDVETGNTAGVLYGYTAAATGSCTATGFKALKPGTTKKTKSTTGEAYGPRWPTAPTGK